MPAGPKVKRHSPGFCRSLWVSCGLFRQRRSHFFYELSLDCAIPGKIRPCFIQADTIRSAFISWVIGLDVVIFPITHRTYLKRTTRFLIECEAAATWTGVAHGLFPYLPVPIRYSVLWTKHCPRRPIRVLNTEPVCFRIVKQRSTITPAFCYMGPLRRIVKQFLGPSGVLQQISVFGKLIPMLPPVSPEFPETLGNRCHDFTEWPETAEAVSSSALTPPSASRPRGRTPSRRVGAPRRG